MEDGSPLPQVDCVRLLYSTCWGVALKRPYFLVLFSNAIVDLVYKKGRSWIDLPPLQKFSLMLVLLKRTVTWRLVSADNIFGWRE